MSTMMELYAGESFLLNGSISLASVVKPSLERMLGQQLNGADIQLSLLEVLDEPSLPGAPAVYNLAPDFGYAYVTVISGGRMIYRHPHSLTDLITYELQEALRVAYPNEHTWGFRIALPQLRHRAVRSTPHVQGAAVVKPFEPGEGPAFGIERVPEPPLPLRGLASFGVQPTPAEQAAAVKVLVSRELQAELMERRPLSDQVEEGGFLLGSAYRDEDRDGAYLVHITGAPQGEQTGASFLHFTFTGDSFTAIKRLLRQSQSRDRIVGWYHTHLFPATERMGLSSIDLRLHFSTFTIPWQLAGLINLDGNRRTLRFYVGCGDRMELCPHWTVDDQR